MWCIINFMNTQIEQSVCCFVHGLVNNTINDQSYWGEKFHSFHRFSTTVNGLLTNFIYAIVSVILYVKSCFQNCQNKPQKFSLHYDKNQ